MPTATTSCRINKAFIITPKDLLHYFNEGQNYIYSNTSASPKGVFISKLRNTDEVLVSDVPDSIINYSNPSKSCIQNIFMYFYSPDKNYSFELFLRNSSLVAPIELTVGGNSPSETEPFFRKIESELNEHCQWYSFLSNRLWLSWLVAKIPSWLFNILWLLLISLLLFLTLRESSILTKARSNINNAINQMSDIPTETNKIQMKEQLLKSLEIIDTRNPFLEMIKGFLKGLLIFIIVYIINRLIMYLFPRAIFEIGSGQQRYSRLKQLRKWVGYWLMTLLIGISLILLGKYL